MSDRDVIAAAYSRSAASWPNRGMTTNWSRMGWESRMNAVSTCPKSAREGRYLLTCCRPEGHTGDCWCNNIREVGDQ